MKKYVGNIKICQKYENIFRKYEEIWIKYDFFTFSSYFFIFLGPMRIPSFLLGSGTWTNSKLSSAFRDWENSGLSCSLKHRPQVRGKDLYFLAWPINFTLCKHRYIVYTFKTWGRKYGGRKKKEFTVPVTPNCKVFLRTKIIHNIISYIASSYNSESPNSQVRWWTGGRQWLNEHIEGDLNSKV